MTHKDYFDYLETKFTERAVITAHRIVDDVEGLSEKELRALVRYQANQIIRLKSELDKSKGVAGCGKNE